MVNRVLSGAALALLVTTGFVHAQPARDLTPAQQAELEALAALPKFETGLVEGRTAQYEITRAIDFTQQSGDNAASAAQSTQSHRMTLEITVASASGDGAGVIEGRLLAFDGRIEDESGPVAVTYDLSGEVDKTDAVASALAGLRFRAEFNAAGNVTTIAGLEEFAAAVAESDLAASDIFSPLDAEQFPRLLSKLANAEGGVEFTAGDAPTTTWTTSENIDLGPSGSLVITRGWTRGKGDSALECSGVYSMALDPPAVANDTAPQGVIEAYAGTGRMLWSPEGGLEFLTSTENVSMRWVLGTMSVRSSQQSSTVIRNVTKD